ncbi:MAG: terminase family protein [Pseudomonadota bacterium]
MSPQLKYATPDEAGSVLADLPKGKLLLPYQAKANAMVAATALLVVEKSRRVGLTWGVAAQAVLTAGAAKSANGTNVYYISYNTDMTKDFIDACSMWAKAFDFASEVFEEELLEDGDEKKAIKVLTISFASGFRIQALSSAPRSLRGKQGLIIIDEAAFVDSLDELLKAALAMMIWGGRVVVISTHNGVDNPFNQLIQQVRSGEKRGTVLRITFDEAIEQGLWERIKLVKPKTTPDKANWIGLVRDTYGSNAAEELDCIPAKGAGSFIDAALIEAAVHPDAGKPELYANGLTYLGRDIARRRDLDITFAFEDVRGSLWQRDENRFHNAKFSVSRAGFVDLMTRYRVARAYLDQTGMGEVEVELMQDKYGESRVQGILFTAAMKLILANALKERFENGTIYIKDCDATKRAFRSVKQMVGTGEIVRLVDDGTSDGHADEFWAAAMASHAANTPYQKFDYLSLNSKQGERLTRDMGLTGRGVSGARGVLA